MVAVSRRPGQAGLSLVEALVGIGMTVVAATGWLLAIVASLQLDEISRQTALASAHATQIIETMRDTPFDQIETTNWQAWSAQYRTAGLSNEDVAVAFGHPLAQLLDVTVTVNWSDRGRLRHLTLATAVAPPQ